LPAYPFTRDQHWVPGAIASSPDEPAPRPNAEFDEEFFSGLLDGLADESLTVGAAVTKTRNSNGSYR
jgi:hypothetical protein